MTTANLPEPAMMRFHVVDKNDHICHRCDNYPEARKFQQHMSTKKDRLRIIQMF